MNLAQQEDKKVKLLVRVWSDMADLMERQLMPLWLRRDEFLDEVFLREAKALKTEIKNRNPDRIKNILQEKINGLERRPMTFAFYESTATLINEACGEKNIPRECFFNRVLFLLFASTANVQRAIAINFDDLPASRAVHARTPRELLKQASELLADPLANIRELIQRNRERASRLSEGMPDAEIETLQIARPDAFSPLHSIPIHINIKDQSLLGLNCCLSDEFIPGTTAYEEARKPL